MHRLARNAVDDVHRAHLEQNPVLPAVAHYVFLQTTGSKQRGYEDERREQGARNEPRRRRTLLYSGGCDVMSASLVWSYDQGRHERSAVEPLRTAAGCVPSYAGYVPS